MAADHRSALPQIPGLPWWGAAILAAAFAAIGVAYDAGSGNQALGGVFASLYVLGCVLAVLAVRQSGVFTAVIQPPLILFIAVPTAYFVFHGSTITGVKDLLINCGYPLIERFPLMFFTSATVLLIGMVRWYLRTAARRGVPRDADAAPVDATPDEADDQAATPTSARRSRRSTTPRASRAASAAAAAVAATADDEAPRAPRRPSRTAAPASQRSGAAAGTGSRRSRHSRPPETEVIDPASSRPRRRSAPPVDSPAEPRRRPRAGEPRESREPREGREPRERRPLPPLDRRSAYERPERSERPQRRERPDPFERPERPERADRPQRRPRVSSDYEPYEPPPTSRSGAGGGTHHPVSRVRYRDAEDGDSRTEHRSKPRPSRHSAPDSWEYDV